MPRPYPSLTITPSPATAAPGQRDAGQDDVMPGKTDDRFSLAVDVASIQFNPGFLPDEAR
jgi:hypothetical protein